MDDRLAYFENEQHEVLLSFLRGERSDWDGRWLADIREWDHARLEMDHHYIQWMFPLLTESEAVFAPVLRDHELEELRQSSRYREIFVSSLRQMLDFYGFELQFENDQPKVGPSDGQKNRACIWMTPGNHNYRRISRILGSLVLAGLSEYAKAFLDALEKLYRTPEGAEAIDGLAVFYWQKRASGR